MEAGKREKLSQGRKEKGKNTPWSAPFTTLYKAFLRIFICLMLHSPFTFQSPHSFCSVHAARFCICIQWERPGGTCWLHLTPSSGFFQLYSWMTLPIIFLSLTVFVVFCVKIMLPIKWVEKYIPLFKILWKNFVKTEIFTNEAKWNFLWRVLIY